MPSFDVVSRVDLQEVIHMLRAADLPVPLQYVNMQR